MALETVEVFNFTNLADVNEIMNEDIAVSSKRSSRISYRRYN